MIYVITNKRTGLQKELHQHDYSTNDWKEILSFWNKHKAYKLKVYGT